MAECTDKKCPIHGEISVRGNVFTGAVISAKPNKTVIVERPIVKFVPKYERYTKSKSRIYAHNPECINAKENDVVKVGETRKLSKTKSFVVIEIIGKKKIVKSEEDTFREHKRVKKEEEKEEKAKEREEEKEEKKPEEKKEEKVSEKKAEKEKEEETAEDAQEKETEEKKENEKDEKSK